MTTLIHTFANVGLIGHNITIEADVNNSLPTLDIIGLPDTAVKESRERIRMTLKNCEVTLPPKKIVINLAPSNVKKQGTRFDLPMAIAILLLVFDVPKEKKKLLSQMLFFGELGLDAGVKCVTGLLPSVLSAYKSGRKHMVIPGEQQDQLLSIPDIHIYPITNFLQLVDYVNGKEELPCVSTGQHVSTLNKQHTRKDVDKYDFGYIAGHDFLKRVLTIAAAGMHNVLLIGPPGSGKTMLAKATRTILPPLNFDESLEVSQLYSLLGKLGKGLIRDRPYRTVHHTASKISIVGGGKAMLPGEISLAHHGILFFDELAEFPREVLEVLRQPLEDRCITISRAHGSVAYPASFMFIATMNPCTCGFYMDKEKSCTCSLHEVKRYQSKISGPLLDRFDIIIEVPRMPLDEVLKTKKTHTW